MDRFNGAEAAAHMLQLQAAKHGGAALIEIIAQPLEDAAAPVLQWMG